MMHGYNWGMNECIEMINFLYIHEHLAIQSSYLKNMRTHSAHCAVGVKLVTTNPSNLPQWSILGNYTQFNKTPNSMKNKIGK